MKYHLVLLFLISSTTIFAIEPPSTPKYGIEMKEARIPMPAGKGQEAPVMIYSMTTSSPEDAPRGMEFLYSLNRFNVATSRARCVCILVASPKLFEPDAKLRIR